MATLEEWMFAICDEYLAQCPRLRAECGAPGRRIVRDLDVPTGAALADTDPVVVSATASEFWPDAFRLSVRLRAVDAVSVNASCRISIEVVETGARVELGTEIRDEIIALEHSARHYN